jgi:hypothetical protein
MSRIYSPATLTEDGLLSHGDKGRIDRLELDPRHPTYGAVADGIADDTTAVQNCLNATVAAGAPRRVRFTQGTYSVNTLTAPAGMIDDLEICGDPGAKLVSRSGGTVIELTGVALSRLHIHHLEIIGGGITTGAGSGIHIHDLTEALEHAHIHDLYIHDCGAHGLAIINLTDYSGTTQELNTIDCGVVEDIRCDDIGDINFLFQRPGPSMQMRNFWCSHYKSTNYAALADFPGTGVTGRLYVDNSNGNAYKWNGSAYVQVTMSNVTGTGHRYAFVSLLAGQMQISELAVGHKSGAYIAGNTAFRMTNCDFEAFVHIGVNLVGCPGGIIENTFFIPHTEYNGPFKAIVHTSGSILPVCLIQNFYDASSYWANGYPIHLIPNVSGFMGMPESQARYWDDTYNTANLIPGFAGPTQINLGSRRIIGDVTSMPATAPDGGATVSGDVGLYYAPQIDQWIGEVKDKNGVTRRWGQLEPPIDISSPLDIPDCVAWWDNDDSGANFTDAARTTTVTADGDVVLSRMDKSGAGNHATAVGSDVTWRTSQYNGRNILRWAGGSYMTFANALSGTAWTMMWAFKNSDVTASILISDSTSGAKYLQVLASGSGIEVYYGGSSTSASGFVVNGWNVGGLYYDGAHIQAICNGVLGNAVVLTGALTFNRMGFYTDTTYNEQGDEAEVAWYNRALTSDERTSLDAYLRRTVTAASPGFFDAVINTTATIPTGKVRTVGGRVTVLNGGGRLVINNGGRLALL